MDHGPQNQTIGNHPRRVGVLGADPVLGLDLKEMLGEAGYQIELLPDGEADISAMVGWASAIVDIGEAGARELAVLERLAEAKVPHVVLAVEPQDLPRGVGNGALRGLLRKPLCVEDLLPLLDGASASASAGAMRAP